MKYLGKELHISHKIFYDFAQENSTERISQPI